MLLGWLERQRGSQDKICGAVLCWDWHPEDPCRRCIFSAPQEYVYWAGTHLHILVYRSGDKHRNAVLSWSVALCFLISWTLRECRILIVTSPVHLSRSLLPFLSSMKFLLPRKTGLQSCLTDWDGVVYSWLSKYSCSVGVFSWWIFTVCVWGGSLIHIV